MHKWIGDYWTITISETGNDHYYISENNQPKLTHDSMSLFMHSYILWRSPIYSLGCSCRSETSNDLCIWIYGLFFSWVFLYLLQVRTLRNRKKRGKCKDSRDEFIDVHWDGNFKTIPLFFMSELRMIYFCECIFLELVTMPIISVHMPIISVNWNKHCRRTINVNHHMFQL